MEQVAKLAETGLLGLLLAISLVTIAFLYREIKSLLQKIEVEREARLNDLKEFSKTDRTFINEMKQTLESIFGLLKAK